MDFDMRKYKIFISGAQKELKAERRAVKDFVLKDPLLSEYFDVFLFEDAPAKSKSAKKAYLEQVRKSDLYAGILGVRYGGTGQGAISPTEAEFREAKSRDKHILIYIKGENGGNDKKRDAGVQRMIKEIRDSKRGFSYKRFNDAGELTRLVHASLIDFLKEEGIVGRGVFDERVCMDASFKDIDEDKVRWFLKIARAARKYPLKQAASVETVFTHLDILKKGKLTNAAVLLFGKNPHHFFLQTEVKCLQFSGTEVKKPFANYQVYSGNLFEQIDKARAFVLDAIKFPVIQKAGSAQFHRPFEIPEFSIQEAIVNAVAHRNYNVTSGVQVMVFADRVEVWNSGSLPEGLTVEDLRKPHTSFPANPLIANVLYLADYAQRAGSGTLEMIEQSKSQGTPEPEFVLIRNLEFRTILPRDVFTEDVLNRMGLNERQMKAVHYAKENSSISLSTLKKAFPDITEKTLYRDLQGLVAKKIFKETGEKRGRKYQIR
ncbi:MAG TPA: ATP-binding protein [bacterium]|nr:ATP-binding protein [bacterium]